MEVKMNIDLNRIKDFFKADRFAMNAGVEIISATEDSVECHMEIKDSHLNAGNGVQGGAIFTLADLTFAIHCNLEKAMGEDVSVTVAQSCAISFLKMAKGSKLIAKSVRLSRGRAISVYRISVEDDLGNPIAEMHGNGYNIQQRI
jgi:acyl-CoA thioesterase